MASLSNEQAAQVRQMLAESVTKNLEFLSNEAREHREYLRTILNRVIWSIGVFILVVSGWFYFSFGEKLVSHELVKWRVEDKVQTYLDDRKDLGIKAALAEVDESIDSSVQAKQGEISAALEVLKVRIRSTIEKMGGSLESAIGSADSNIKTKLSEFERTASSMVDNTIKGKIRALSELDVDELIRKGLKGDPGENGVDATAPVGAIIAWMSTNPLLPPGWHKCDHTEVKELGLDTEQEQRLRRSTVIKDDRLPDLRGYFLRGLDDRAKEDGGLDVHRHERNKGVGSSQNDDVGSFNILHATRRVSDSGPLHASLILPPPAFGEKRREDTSQGSVETRPVNIAVHWIIRVK